MPRSGAAAQPDRSGASVRRVGTAFLTRHRHVTEEHYKSPQLHEQELRTRLATLKVGERLVRAVPQLGDGVRIERAGQRQYTASVGQVIYGKRGHGRGALQPRQDGINSSCVPNTRTRSPSCNDGS